MVIDCTLGELKVPGFSGVNPQFGTKKPDGQSITAREADVNIRMPFARQRPYHVGEDSVTSVIEAHSAFTLEAAGITLTLGNGGFANCEANVMNSTTGLVYLSFGSEQVVSINAGNVKTFIWTGSVWTEKRSYIPLSARGEPFMSASNKRQLVVKAGVKIDVGSGDNAGAYFFDHDTELNVEQMLDSGSALVNGKDYYVFVCREAVNTYIIKVSTEKTAPAGFEPENVKAIGGFHTLCVNAGTAMTYIFGGQTLQHPLNDYVAGDILPASVWCLNHRPFSEPEGMVYINLLDFWCDIYLQSGNGINTKSAYQGAITRSRQYVDFVEDQFCVKKALLNDEEFAAAMLGGNEKTNVLGSSEGGATTGGAGGRKDTANRRMISIFGVEEGCGSLWQWLATTAASGGTGWTGQSGGKGDYYGECCVLLAGGDWSDGADCGSRARYANYARADANANIGGRGRSRPMRSSF